MKSPPSFRVAEVRITERSAKSFSLSRPDTFMGGDAQGGPEAVVPLVPDDVPLGAVDDPLRHVVHVLHGGQGLLADRVLVLHGLVARGADRGDDGAGGVAERHERVRQILRDLLQAARQGQLHQLLEALGGGLELVRGLLVHQLGGAAHRTVDLAGGQLARGDAGDPGHQFVGLVDDQHLVLRQHGRALDGVDGQQRVVGDDDLRELGVLAGRLGEALRPVGALRGAEALPGGHRHLPPQARSETPGGEVVAVAGLRLVRPVPQPQQVLAQLAGGRGGLELVEQALLLVLRHALVQAVQAQVVGPALEHRELRPPAQQGVQRVHRAREVTLHELALQCQRGGRDDDPLAVCERRHEVAERLSGAGAGLDEQVGAVVDGLGDGLGHGHLAGALRAADGADGGMEEFVE
ncbi:hypothetical protein GCM10020256_17930 [Streptomyces thermocoprophilus]